MKQLYITFNLFFYFNLAQPTAFCSHMWQNVTMVITVLFFSAVLLVC